MNLSRAIASAPATKRSLLRSLSLFQSANFSKTTAAKPRTRWSIKSQPPTQEPDTEPARPVTAPPPKPSPPDPVEWPRPAEIPWQPKVANSVHLIGSIARPVHLDVAPDGVYWAFSALEQTTDEFSKLWIPILFEGDLAQIAAGHLKENELVYVTGQISGEPTPLSVEKKQTSIQVMVHTLSYVQKSWSKNKPLKQNESASSRAGSTPKNVENEEKLWQDLKANPEDWRDHRLDKKNGLVKPRFPDFKHKVTGQALWLNSAPEWIHSELEGVDFNANHFFPPKQESDEQILPKKILDGGDSREGDFGAKMTICKENGSKLPKKSSTVERGSAESSWKDLLENPANWWDNRSDKINPRSPDFKNKVTGEALWISSSSTPTWVLPNLPPSRPKQEVKVM